MRVVFVGGCSEPPTADTKQTKYCNTDVFVLINGINTNRASVSNNNVTSGRDIDIDFDAGKSGFNFLVIFFNLIVTVVRG